jgi:hypothetical protein
MHGNALHSDTYQKPHKSFFFQIVTFIRLASSRAEKTELS